MDLPGHDRRRHRVEVQGRPPAAAQGRDLGITGVDGVTEQDETIEVDAANSSREVSTYDDVRPD
jgi:hypothetical protein